MSDINLSELPTPIISNEPTLTADSQPLPLNTRKQNGGPTPILIGIIVLLTLIILFLVSKNYLQPYLSSNGITDEENNLFAEQENESTKIQTTYTDPLGFTLEYPDNILLNPQTANEIENNVSLFISTLNIADINSANSPLTSQEVKQDEEALQLNKLAAITLLKDPKNYLVKIDSLTGRESLTTSAFEECDVQFTQSLVFYYNNYQVNIYLKIPKQIILQSVPEYLTDSANEQACPDKVWKPDLSSNIYDRLMADAKREPTAVQQWKQQFDQIVSSIKLN